MTTLAGRLAVVTGASRGIGAATARALAGAGARVVRVSRSLPPTRNDRYLDHRCDLTDPAAVDALAARVLGAEGAPAVVVNSAGVFLLQPLERTTTAEFDEQVAVNLRGSFLLARAFATCRVHARHAGM